MTSKRRAMTGPMGTPMPKQVAYVLLDGYAGRTKLFGVIVAQTHARLCFVPDRDCYRFRKGVRKWVDRRHVRMQYVRIQTVEEAAESARGGGK